MTDPKHRSNSAPRGFFPRLAGLPVRHPRLTLLIAAACIVLALLAVTRIQPGGSLAAMFPRHQPSAHAFGRITERFDAADQLLVMASIPAEAQPSGETSASLRRFARRFEDALQNNPRAAAMVERVEYRPPWEMVPFIEEIVAPSLLFYLDEGGVENLRGRLSRERMAERVRHNETLIAAPGAAGRIAKQIVRDPLRLYQFVAGHITPAGGFAGIAEAPDGMYLSPDGRSLLIRVHAAQPAGDMEFVREFMPAVRGAADRADPGELSVEYAGAHAIAETAQRSIRADMIRSIVGSVILLQVLFLLTYRNVLSFPLAFGPVAAGILIGFAVGSYFTPTLTPPTAVLGAILAGLGIDYAIHYLSHYHGGVAPGGGNAAEVSRSIGPALAAACVTSVLAFAAIAFSDVRALRDFAVIGVAGLIASLVAVLAILPAVLSLWHSRPRRRMRHRPDAQLRWSIRPLLHRIIHHRRISMAVTAAVFIAAAGVLATAPAGPLDFESDMHVMHPQPNAPLTTQQTIAERFAAAPESLMIHLVADTPNELTALAHTVRRRLRTPALRERYVAGTFGLANLLPDPATAEERLNAARSIDVERVIRDFDAALADSAFDPEAFDEYRQFLRRMLRPDRPPGMEELMRFEGLARPILARPASIGGAAPTEAVTQVFLRETLSDRDRRDETITTLRVATADLPGATLTGLPVIAADTQRAVRGGLARSATLAAGLVAVWLLIFFRSVRDAALALLPAVFGIGVVLAVMRLSGVSWNMVNLIAMPLLAGLGVDDGIFLVSTARTARTGRERIAGLASSCHAVAMTSATTMLAFGSLMLTSTPAIRSLGLVLAAGVGACLFATLCGLAPLLMRKAGGPVPGFMSRAGPAD